MIKKLSEIKEFVFGSFWLGICSIALFAILCSAIFENVPEQRDLLPKTGTLIEPIKVHKARNVCWASINFKSTEGVMTSRVENYCYLTNRNILDLDLPIGSKVVVWISSREIEKNTNATIWQMQNDKRFIFSLEQTKQAVYDRRERLIYMSLIGCLIGLVFMLVGVLVQRKNKIA